MAAEHPRQRTLRVAAAMRNRALLVVLSPRPLHLVTGLRRCLLTHR